MEKKDKDLIDQELEEIVRLLKAENQKALRLFRDKYFTPLRYMARRLNLTDLEDFPEILNDVLIIVWEKRKDFPDGQHLMAFVKTAIKHDIIDKGRKRGLNITPLENTESDHWSTDAVDVIDCRNIMMKIFQSIDGMEGYMKEVMLLYFREKKELKEIASLLSIPAKQLHTYLTRGIEKLVREHTNIHQIIEREAFEEAVRILKLFTLLFF